MFIKRRFLSGSPLFLLRLDYRTRTLVDRLLIWYGENNMYLFRLHWETGDYQCIESFFTNLFRFC